MRIDKIKIIHVLWMGLFLWSLKSIAQEEAPPPAPPEDELITTEDVLPPEPSEDESNEQEVVVEEASEAVPAEPAVTQESVQEEVPLPPPADEPVVSEAAQPLAVEQSQEEAVVEEKPAQEVPVEPAAIQESVQEEVPPAPPADEPVVAEGAQPSVTEPAQEEVVVEEKKTVQEVPTQEIPAASPVEQLPVQEQIQPTVPVEQSAASREEKAEVGAESQDSVDEKNFGINTVDVDNPQGNWLFKRIWYEKAQAKYEKIKKAVAAIFEARTPFFTERTAIDRNTLDPFYMAVGFGQGEMQAITDQLIAELEEEREEEGDLDSEERDLLQKLQEEKGTLEQLQKDIQLVGTIDESIDGALKTLMNEVNRARSYEKQAWNNLKMISEELSDEKAREKFYVIDTLWRNIQNITQYIQGPYSQYFQQLVSSTQSNVERIKATLEILKTKGIDFKKEADRLEKKEKPEVAEEVEEQEEIVEPKKGWFQSTFEIFWNPIKSVGVYTIQTVQSLWNYAFSWMGGSKPEDLVTLEVDEVDVESTPQSDPEQGQETPE